MSVYVDNAHIPAVVHNGRTDHSSTRCHLMADTLEELLAFRSRIGMRSSWLQVKPSGVHFDLTDGKRAQALRAGALELDQRDPHWVRVMHDARAQYLEIQASGLGVPLRAPDGGLW